MAKRFISMLAAICIAMAAHNVALDHHWAIHSVVIVVMLCVIGAKAKGD